VPNATEPETGLRVTVPVRRRLRIPDRIVQPDQGRRHLALRSLARSPKRAAGSAGTEGRHGRSRRNRRDGRDRRDRPPGPPRPAGRMASMTAGLAVGGDVEGALASIPVPSYVLDTAGSSAGSTRLLSGYSATSAAATSRQWSARRTGRGRGSSSPQGARHDRGDRDQRGSCTSSSRDGRRSRSRRSST
jgi:hypothetical protein